MSFVDALFGDGPQLSDQAKAYQVQGLDFASPYASGLAGDAQARGQQQAYLAQLQQMAQGQGAGAALADAQMQQSLGRAEAGVANQIASNRGLSPATKAFILAQTQGQAGAQAAAGAAATRAQQQLGAQGQLGSALGMFRGQDQALAGLGAQGQMQQQGLQANAYGTALGANTQFGIARAQADNAALGNVAGLISGVGQAAGGFGLARKAHGGEVLDSEAQDTVPAMLSPGERVVPASIAEDPDQSRDFLQALNDVQDGKKSKRKLDKNAVLKALAAKASEFQRRLEFLESKLGGAQ